MPTFQFRGYAPDGSEQKGTLEASGIRDAVAQVRAAGIFPRDVTEVLSRPRRRLRERSHEAFLPHMTRQLAVLLSTSVPLVDALQTLSSENQGFYKAMLTAAKERVLGGSSLHKALAESGDIFPDFYINMVEAGEASGSLDRVLVRLADYLEAQNEIRAKARASMTYPVLMLGVSGVVLSFLFTFVIPKIVKIFKDTKATLPLITKVLIFVSNFFVNYWWLVIIVVVAGTIYTKRLFKRHRSFVDRLLLKLPGNVIQSLYYARFSRTLAFLLDGGIPLLRALRLSAKSMGNRALEASVITAEARVTEGRRLSTTLEGFPPVFIQLIATGEKSGRLSETLNKAAQSYEQEFTRGINRAISLLEPAMILLMGVVVGIIVLAVLLPMFQLNQLVK